MPMNDHIDFLATANTVKSNCMISHYPCKLYDEALSGWHKHTFLSMTRSGQALECCYMNYEKPTILADFSYLGNNFIQRQQLKRKSHRLVSKISSLPAIEQQYLLNVLNKQFKLQHS
jgi:hypothetical protein